MKNLLFKTALLLLFINATSLFAQKLETKLMSPNPYFLNSDDIFNIQITNPLNIEIEVKLIGIWKFNGSNAVSIYSDKIILKAGFNQFNSANISIIDKTYHNQMVEESESSTGKLPHGAYNACLIIQCATYDCSGAGNNILSTEQNYCFDVSVLNPTPLILVSPYNGSTVNSDRPNFIWLPPMPIYSEDDLTYKLRLVKKTDKSQSCLDAIKRNRPLFEQESISNPIQLFPGDMDGLDSGEYAWQVTAYSGRNIVGESDAWCFNIGEDSIKKDENIVFVKLTTTDKDIHHIRNNLFFIYEELYTPQQLAVKIFNQNGIEIGLSQNFNTIYGENRFTLEVESLNLEKGVPYLLKIKDQAGKNYNLRFQVL